MKNLCYYAELIESGKIRYAGTKKTVYANSCSLAGYALELAVRDYFGRPLEISGNNANDVVAVIDGKKRFIEVKHNSSPLSTACGILEDGKLIGNRSSLMAYSFYVDLDKPLCKQYGYVMSMKDFLSIGFELNHIKAGTENGGKNRCLKTQTVYNNSKKAFHGKKAFKLEERYLQVDAVSFKEFFK